jgi:hypothetical protein
MDRKGFGRGGDFAEVMVDFFMCPDQHASALLIDHIITDNVLYQS